MMRWTDPTIETVLCGSSGRSMATFGKWEWDSLHEAYDQTDYLSLHTYYGNRDNDTASFLAQPDNMDDFIKESAALCDAVRASKKSKKRINLSFDEWNVWYHSNGAESKSEKWSVGRPILEDIYNMEDALVFGGMLISLLNNADRVKIGCLAQVVNVIGPIMTEPTDQGGRSWKQTIFHPFAAASLWGGGTALHSLVKAPTYHSKSRDEASIVLIASVVQNDTLTVFAVNREPSGESVELKGILRGFATAKSAEHSILIHPDLKAINTADAPNTVAPQAAGIVPKLEGETFTATLPPYSWNVIRFSL